VRGSGDGFGNKRLCAAVEEDEPVGAPSEAAAGPSSANGSSQLASGGDRPSTAGEAAAAAQGLDALAVEFPDFDRGLLEVMLADEEGDLLEVQIKLRVRQCSSQSPDRILPVLLGAASPVCWETAPALDKASECGDAMLRFLRHVRLSAAHEEPNGGCGA
jgi:hypothetical protein